MKTIKSAAILGIIWANIFSLTACATNNGTINNQEIMMNGKKYVLLKTVVAHRDKGLTDVEYKTYFNNGDSSTAVLDMVRAGNIYVNGYQIPYLAKNGRESSKELVVGGERMLWLEGGLGYQTWNWRAQKMWHGSGRNLTAAAYDLATNLTYREGEIIKLYARKGSNTTDLIRFAVINTALVTGIHADTTDNTVTVKTIMPTEKGDVAATVKIAGNQFDSGIKVGDIAILTDDAVTGMSAEKATAVKGRLIPTANIKNPQWLAAGAAKAVDFSDGLIDRSYIPEYAKNTQFIRGHRRLNLYAYDADITMWQTSTGYSIGFTRGNSAKGALEYAIGYAESQVSKVRVSTDGRDVPGNTYWVTQDVWDVYQKELMNAKALLSNGSATNLDYDAAILKLANALGGTEDVGQKFVQNSLGVIGSMKKGTKPS